MIICTSTIVKGDVEQKKMEKILATQSTQSGKSTAMTFSVRTGNGRVTMKAIERAS